MSSNEISKSSVLFKELVDNGFDFLEKAIDEFDSKPKYSVVHFSTALELILKARLVHEHWALIVDGKPELKSFKQGDFKSINFSDIISRIEGILDIKIPKEAKDAFASIGAHRNRMVHFFHEVDLNKKNEKLTERIAVEQSVAWYHLQQLISKWHPVFSEYSGRIDMMNIKMQTHNSYLLAVYEQKRPGIENDKKAGKIYVECASCSHEASLLNEVHKNIYDASCKVCLYSMSLINVSCSCCEAPVKVSNEEFPGKKCQECQEEVTLVDVKNQFDTNRATYNEPCPLVINCALCLESDAVTQYDDVYFCTNCFHYDASIAICNSCDEWQLAGGDLEDSYLKGCEFCDGQGHDFD